MEIMQAYLQMELRHYDRCSDQTTPFHALFKVKLWPKLQFQKTAKFECFISMKFTMLVIQHFGAWLFFSQKPLL